MAFDPDAYLASKKAAAATPAVAPSSTPSGFDPDAYLAEKKSAASPAVSQAPAYEPQGGTEKFFQSLFPRSFETAATPEKVLPFDASQPDFIDSPGGKIFNFKKYQTRPDAGRSVAAAVADVASLPGRALATTPEVVGAGADLLRVPTLVRDPGQYGQNLKSAGSDITSSLGKTESDKTGVAGFGADIIRSPATGVGLATGGLGIVPAALTAAATTQVANVGEGKDVNPGEAALEFGTAAVGGKVAGKLLGAAADKVSAIANKRASLKLFKQLAKANKEVTPDIRDTFLKYEVRGNVDEAMDHVKGLVDRGTRDINTSAERLVHPDAPLETVRRNAFDLLKEIPVLHKQGTKHADALDHFQTTIRDIAPDGNMNFHDLLHLKRAVDDIRDFDIQNPKPLVKTLAGQYRKLINDEMKSMLAEARKNPNLRERDIKAIDMYLKGTEEVSELMPILQMLNKRSGKVAIAQEDETVGNAIGDAALQVGKNLVGIPGEFAEGAINIADVSAAKAQTLPGITLALKRKGFDMPTVRQAAKRFKDAKKVYDDPKTTGKARLEAAKTLIDIAQGVLPEGPSSSTKLGRGLGNVLGTGVVGEE